MSELSKTQIDRLGDRLRKVSTDEDLILLDNYRRSFGDAYEIVITTTRDRCHLEPTGRPAKSTRSIIEKLNRETIRLTQIQDIAGCRLVVNDLGEQDQLVESLSSAFPEASLVDRRANPSYGYRAVHVIAKISGKLVEIQVRTSLQHLWAEISEKFSDVADPEIKYGGGPEPIRTLLQILSKGAQSFEEVERDILDAQKNYADEEQQERLRQTLPLAIEWKTRHIGLYKELLETIDRGNIEQPS